MYILYLGENFQIVLNHHVSNLKNQLVCSKTLSEKSTILPLCTNFVTVILIVVHIPYQLLLVYQMQIHKKDLTENILEEVFGMICIVGVKVRNMKMDFNTGGTWRRVGNKH